MLMTKSKALEHKRRFHQHLRELDRKFFAGEFGDQELFTSRRCVVCNGTAMSDVFRSPGNYQYQRCDGCQMVMMQPIPSAENLHGLYNSEEMSFNASGSALNSSVRAKGVKDVQIIQQFQAGGRLLDIGCGVGAFVKAAERHFRAEGLEINQRHAEVAQANQLTVHNTYSSDFAPGHLYDVVTMNQVIEHLPSPGDVLRDAKRLLRPGGILFIACPNFDSSSVRLFRERHRHFSSFGHINMYSPQTLRQHLENEGFECLQMSTYRLDIELHDLLYFYLNRDKFSHRFSNYNALVQRVCKTLYIPFKTLATRRSLSRLRGSYLRGIFRSR